MAYMAPPEQQAMVAGNPLDNAQGVYVKQVFEMIELCGCEIPNRYKVYPLGPDGKSAATTVPVLYVKERMNGFCGCLYKQLCGPCREYTADVFIGPAPGGSSLGEIHKTCGVGYCIACFGSETSISNAMTRRQARVEDTSSCLFWPCCGASMKVDDMDIAGGCMFCAGPCCTYDMEITQGGKHVGQMSKLAGGCGECLTGANKYAVVFPPNADGEKKLALLGAAMHLDFTFFERKKGDN